MVLAIRHGALPKFHRSVLGNSSSTRAFASASRSAIDSAQAQPPFPVLEDYPDPTCQCAELPEGLEIDKEHNINGSMAAYAEHVLVSTGRSEWKSRIEQDDDAVLVRRLKAFLGPRGKYSDPYHNVLITNSSFPPSRHSLVHRSSASTSVTDDRDSTSRGDVASSPPASAFILPSFQYIPTIPTDPASIEALIRGYIKPLDVHRSSRETTDTTLRQQQQRQPREPELQGRFVGARAVQEVLVLICGHGNRDQRCGVFGPLLKKEFEDKFRRQGVAVIDDPPAEVAETAVDKAADGFRPSARVGITSHIGGHRWAGNVIVYIPPGFSGNPLAGKGIWYGRVEPKHVEGIVGKTVLEGKVIKELFRGGVGPHGEVLRL